MNFRDLFEKTVDFIDEKRKSIVAVSLSALGILVLIIVFFLSSNEFSVGNEANELLKIVEKRQYSIAVDYYASVDKKFSDSKMERFNKSISKKINKLLLNSGDKYLDGDISQESFIGLINTVKSLDKININVDDLITQANRVGEMYKEENITYNVAISYINTISILNGIGGNLDVYKQNVETIKESRDVYDSAVKDQKVYKYYDAIEKYNKVLKEDEKYYNLAQNAKKQCVEEMYDYYISKAEEANTSGDYEKALQYIDYLKEDYSDDEKVQSLEKKYKKNLSLYTLTSDDIINIISKKSGKEKANLSINSLPQMVKNDKYYYAEVYEYDKLINEVLISAKTKDLYSYKDGKKDYKVDYGEGYFRILEDGSYQFGITKDKAKFVLTNTLDEKENKYKKVDILDIEKADKYVKSKKSLEELFGKQKNIYYYAVVNKGLFRGKEVYAINIYNEKIYSISEKGLSEY
ncbi:MULTISPECIES: UbiD family decarboxylase [unclassified Clostridioides]|uniref:UbiD family decarboxylase n=1 Tax=unclassified Clostridioides TaxID=2635829 RepID=UPI001D10614B|nr:UbiD family decarboxylase [Clostridioides sp. ES-S-0001-02]MCC0640290.1 UbiD family decarboxylase [Clostridioides sp. ES-S-0049-03]MCC0657733.1 UbiD family decarboxylase [Clostridioides sp. ES-S-0123-01]MCC0671203.1 UbiD family decarboxylase [Clostridioides sp. ES-S-0145-01]MCC0677041.1 UbiD family decarboxylase [Clostridioides sp. ES-W-0018-02]MCC0708108.1 UbiD family decarboxylase [Clostridioides sp. ES-S-0190-01]MCC0711576.1 UbiD family decarboxylase [Clostridioides sp. ES-W-0017-02]